MKKDGYANDGRIKIATTTTIFYDLIQNIGKDKVDIMRLMGPGVDPHVYKASENDVIKIFSADIVIYGGLHLEGKLINVFEKLERYDKIQVNLGSSLPKEKLRESADFGGNYDPHVWFNISLFKEEAKEVARILSDFRPEDKVYFEENLNQYLNELTELEINIRNEISSIPESNRILVTAHDAFGYFGDEYGFEVVGLQGISTATEAGVKDVRELTDFIVRNKVKSIFIESSIPVRTIEALRQAVLSKNHQVEIGGMLYSDALGSEGTPEETYIGMFQYNVNTIVNGLK